MTLNATKPFLESAEIHSDNTLDESELAAVHRALDRLGTVPLVHAQEFDLTPDGSPAMSASESIAIPTGCRPACPLSGVGGPADDPLWD
jgi:hypothetical protein